MSEAVINYGVVGLGRAGWNMHVAQLRARPDAKIVAVVDTEPDRRRQAVEELGCRAYGTLDELLAEGDIDAIVIATPSHLHAPYAQAAFAAGKHVCCDKPMATSLAEADAMIASAERAGKKLFIHHNLRFTREWTHLREVIDSGILGRLFHLRLYSAQFARRNDWQTLSKYGGGLLNNAGSHYLDLTLPLLGGKVVQVMGDLPQIASLGDVEDHVKILLRTDNRVTADLEISTVENIAVRLPKWILCGSQGTLTSDGKTSTIRWFDPAQAPKLELRDGPAVDRIYGSGETLPWQAKTVPAQGPDIGGFYDNVFSVLRKGGTMHVTPQSVREVIRVIGEVRKSAGRA